MRNNNSAFKKMKMKDFNRNTAVLEDRKNRLKERLNSKQLETDVNDFLVQGGKPNSGPIDTNQGD